VLSHRDETQFELDVTSLEHVRGLDIKLVTAFHLLNSSLETFTLEMVSVSLSGVSDCFVVLNSNLLEEVFNSLSNCE
jgi:hypothetical protein